MASQSWHICTLIPVRNDDARIAHCLKSVYLAQLMLPPDITSDVIIAVDRSGDNVMRIAAELQDMNGAIVMTGKCSAGEARRIAAAAAVTRYSGRLNRCWLANLDADCTVPRSWLAGQIALARQGVEAVSGVVCSTDLGVRADALSRAGGWHDLESGEKQDLWRRLSAVGATCISNPDPSYLLPLVMTEPRIANLPAEPAQFDLVKQR